MSRSIVARIIGLASIAGFVSWLTLSGSPNHWTDSTFVREQTRPLSRQEQTQLLEEVEAVAKCAGITLHINLNTPFHAGELNLYVISSAGRRKSEIAAGDARYVPGQNVFLIDEDVVWPSASKVLFAGLNISDPSSRSDSARLWFEFVLLHEMGHSLLHRYIHSPTETEAIRIEDEADDFAFNRIAQLITHGSQSLLDEEGLFSMSRVAALPQPDRTLSTIASIIQYFSINQLFSETTFSPYHRDRAHKAFVARFKPLLIRLLTESTTRDGKTFVLLALASVDRIAAVGEGVVKELKSDLPIESLSLRDDGLIVTVGLKGGTFKQVSISLSSDVGLPEADMLSPAMLASAPTVQPSDPATIDQSQASSVDGVTDDALVQLLSRHYSGAQQCEVTRSASMSNLLDVVFSCRQHDFAQLYSAQYYLARYDQHNGQLVEVKFVRVPGLREGDAGQLVDIRISGERQTYLIQDSLSYVTPHAHRDALTVWALLSSPTDNIAKPKYIGQMDLVTDWIPSGTTIIDWLRIAHPPTPVCRPIASDIVCVEFLDSVFRFSPVSSRLSVLFYPAGAVMRFNGRGLYAFYAPGGHRVFFVR